MTVCVVDLIVAVDVRVTVGLLLSILVAAALVHHVLFHALSVIVTLHVPLYSEIVQLHHAVAIHDTPSVLFANVAVTVPFVGVVSCG